MIAFEAMHHIKRKMQGKEGLVALKLDISKAYNHLEWNFIQRMLFSFSFSERWINIIIVCIFTVKYSIIHGEHDIGSILPGYGLR